MGREKAELTYCNLCKMQISSLMTAAILCSIVVSGTRAIAFVAVVVILLLFANVHC